MKWNSPKQLGVAFSSIGAKKLEKENSSDRRPLMAEQHKTKYGSGVLFLSVRLVDTNGLY